MKINEVITESRQHPEQPIYYFAYGMLTDPQLMDSATLVGVGKLPNFTYKMYCWANVEPSPGKVVYGCLWQLARKKIAELDLAEGYPKLYDRRTYPVYVNGYKYAAEVYIMTPDTLSRVQDTKPKNGYIRRIKRGYTNAGVPLSQLYKQLKLLKNTRSVEANVNDPSPWSDR
jgi:gamma-glutamylcyclotransferase (GGCT)/AIG2-like uncharacterized protein YtfP